MRGQSAPVRPDVLRWARESSGLTPEDAASRIPIPVNRLIEAEAGGSPLTLIQARKAAEVYERPFAVLFLPSPPAEDPIEVQFRRFRHAPALPWLPAMRALAREVPALQEEVDALLEALEEEPRWADAAEVFTSTQDLEEIGSRLRGVIGVSVDDQKAAARRDPQGFRVFRVWREAIEDLGILVLQDGSLTLDDMRGFASPHRRVPALVINTNDDVRARLFTMLHELAHLFWAVAEEARYEQLAGTALMPATAFSADFAAAPGTTLLQRIDATARLYGTTPDAAAVRSGWLGLAPWKAIDDVRRQIHSRGGQGSHATGGNFYRNVVVRMGPRLVSRVLGAVDESVISELSAARLLGIRVERFDALRRELGTDAA
jgi:transcriptional regulator with XRE-family HTH domain